MSDLDRKVEKIEKEGEEMRECALKFQENTKKLKELWKKRDEKIEEELESKLAEILKAAKNNE